MDEMKKYIIEFSEDPHTIRLMKIKNGDKFPTTEFKTVIPYTEDSAYAHGYTEAESKYREIRDELEKQAYQRGYEEAYDTAYADAEGIYESGKRAMYQKGLKDAWEAARKIRDMSWKEQKEVFETDCYADIIALSVSECIEKIRQYEQGKEGRITKGDVVRMKSAPEIEILVTYEDEAYVGGIALTKVDDSCEIGDQFTDIVIHKVEKTGRHYEIEEVLRKIREG